MKRIKMRLKAAWEVYINEARPFAALVCRLIGHNIVPATETTTELKRYGFVNVVVTFEGRSKPRVSTISPAISHNGVTSSVPWTDAELNPRPQTRVRHFLGCSRCEFEQS